MTPEEQFRAIPIEQKLAAVKKFYIDMANCKPGDEQTQYEVYNNAMAGWIVATIAQLMTDVHALQVQVANQQEYIAALQAHNSASYIGQEEEEERS